MNVVTENIRRRRESCGYAVPAHRSGCRNCQHSRETLHNTGSWAESVSFTCGLHDFTVSKGAICDDYLAPGQARSAA